MGSPFSKKNQTDSYDRKEKYKLLKIATCLKKHRKFSYVMLSTERISRFSVATSVFTDWVPDS